MGVEAVDAHEHDEELPLRPVLTLTEEELLVLTNGSLGVVPARLQVPDDPAAADLVHSVALRCLMARGLVLPTGGSPQGGSGQQVDSGQPAGAHEPAGAGQPMGADEQTGVSWEAVEPLGLTLQLRELAPTVLGLGRALGTLASDPAGQSGGPESEGTTAVRYLHLHEEIAVIEDVTDGGMHSFLTVFPDRYQDAVADFIRPPDATAGQGAVRSLDRRVDELLEELGNPTVLVETNLITGLGEGVPPEPVSQMLTLGPGGSYRSHDSRAYHPVDPDGAIADLLRDALGAALPGEAQAGNGGAGEVNGAGAGGPT